MVLFQNAFMGIEIWVLLLSRSFVIKSFWNNYGLYFMGTHVVRGGVVARVQMVRPISYFPTILTSTTNSISYINFHYYTTYESLETSSVFSQYHRQKNKNGLIHPFMTNFYFFSWIRSIHQDQNFCEKQHHCWNFRLLQFSFVIINTGTLAQYWIGYPD